MKIGLVIPFHLRGEETNLCYAKTFWHYITLDLKYTMHLCGSEGLFSKNVLGWVGEPYYKEVPQESITILSAGDDVLRKKFNDSLATLPKNLDWYCLAGADDIVSIDFFEQLKQLDPSGIKMAGVGMDQPLYLLDESKGWNAHKIQIRYSVKLDLLPGINCFSRDAMEACDWRPYQRKGCETGAELLFRDLGKVIPLKGSVTMLKGDKCLNSLKKILRFHKSLPLTQQERDYLRSLV
jgi:hypothetical protein